MTVSRVLEDLLLAKVLLEDGWAPPEGMVNKALDHHRHVFYAWDAKGEPVAATIGAAVKFSISGALWAVTKTLFSQRLKMAEAELINTLKEEHPITLKALTAIEVWEQAPIRQPRHVLALFDRTIKRLKQEAKS